MEKLPTELAYDTYSPTRVPSGVTVGSPTGTTSKTVTRKVMGTLKEGESIELLLTTKVVQMPAEGQQVKNVACLVVSGKETCDEEIIIPCTKSSLWIKKTFADGSTTEKLVKVGDTIEYKISF